MRQLKAPAFRWSVFGPLFGILALMVFLLAIWPWVLRAVQPLLPSIIGRTDTDHRRLGTIAEMRNIESAIEAFGADTGRYPSTTEGLAALVTPPPGLAGWQGPYMNILLLDQWGTPYRYVCPSTSPTKAFDLVSVGPDRAFGTADDFTPESEP
jgi:general secretion pathway protein G